jgi:hypothetical protein
MQDLIEKIAFSVDKKKVQGLCKKILKKCNFKSSRDLDNVVDLATWLYIYGYDEKAAAVCDLLDGIPFTRNYDIWHRVDTALCLKARILREQGEPDGREELLERINERRDPKLYLNGADHYRNYFDANIRSGESLNSKATANGWRLCKMRSAIYYREPGGFPISDEEFDRDIQDLVNILKQEK